MIFTKYCGGYKHLRPSTSSFRGGGTVPAVPLSLRQWGPVSGLLDRSAIGHDPGTTPAAQASGLALLHVLFCK